jgi:ferric-dicitrate binding protein FerR (iron transport regulator)
MPKLLLTASLDDTRRDIVLERGEACFEVAKDPQRTQVGRLRPGWRGC